MFVLCQIYFSKNYQNLYTKFRGSQVSLTWINNITAVHFYFAEKAGEHVFKITDVKSNNISMQNWCSKDIYAIEFLLIKDNEIEMKYPKNI